MIDVGANTGQFARRALAAFPEASIYSFEPQVEPCRELRRWVEGSGIKRVTPFNVALGEEEGEFEMRVHLDYSAPSFFLDTTRTCHAHYPFTERQAAERVRITTLDRFVVSCPLDIADDLIVKVDVQGFEDRVLRGARTLMARARGCILEPGR